MRFLPGGCGIQITVTGMQIAQAGGLLGVAHVDAVKEDVGAGAAEGLALTNRLPGKPQSTDQQLSKLIHYDQRPSTIDHPGKNSLKDAPVHHQHHNAGYPEAHRTGDEGVGLVDHKRALVRMQGNLPQVLLRRVPAQKDGREGYEGGQDPHIGEHEADRFVCHIQWILQWTHNGVVSVKKKRGSSLLMEMNCGQVLRTKVPGGFQPFPPHPPPPTPAPLPFGLLIDYRSLVG